MPDELRERGCGRDGETEGASATPSHDEGTEGADKAPVRGEGAESPARARLRSAEARNAAAAPSRGEEASRSRSGRASWRTALSVVFALIAAPLALLVGQHFDGGSAYATSTAVILCALAPFLASFERRRPQAREIVLVAVVCAIAVASRVAFFWLPFFKPVIGVIVIAGLALGAPTGFLVGAVTALASDFFFGQGPWTPWQMLAFGVAGLAFGLLSDFRILPRSRLSVAQRVLSAVGAGAVTLLVTGPILDTSGLFLFTSAITPESVAAVYLAGLSANAALAACSALVVLLAANPLLDKLDRVRVKHGMFE